ncbi:annexin A13-like [Mytilus galloprovincialis]|uniref:annexin A13-like n=1 Tax=Mytilus galloprovincialis TaxID=29158 RepID=UPI003F7CBCCB
MMAYPPPGGYNPYAYQNPYQQNPYCGGYTYSNSAYNVNYGQQQQAYNQYYSQPQMQQAPPSQQTNIVYNMMFNSDAAFQQAGAECLGMDLDDVEVSDVEDEEEEEDEDEDVKETRKKFKKKCKKRQKIAQKVAEKCAEEDDFLERVRASYIGRLAGHLVKDGTIDPTEGTVKPYKTYDAEDPVVAFINEKEGLDITGNDWDAERDCMYFDEAMQGLGTNEEAIIHICATRCNSQRQELKKMFKTAFGKDLIETLDGEVSGDFSEVLFALFEPPALFDALNIKKAIQGLGTDESVLIEILLTRTNAQIEEMKSVYGSINPDDCATDKDLECNIEDDTSGDLKRILISAAQGNRAEVKEEKLNDAVVPVMFHDEETDEDLPTGAFTIDMEKLIDPDRAQADAEVLFNAGVDRFGTDEDDFIRIFALRDTYQLRETYNRYVKLTQCDIENSVEGEFSSHSQMALITLIKSIKCRPKYFAERLTWTMEGLGTKDKDLIRIIVGRSEIDMVQIKEIFLEKNKQTLWNWIKDDCSGDYKALLQRIVGRD